MVTIQNNVIDEIIINKSKFITYMYKVDTSEECKKIIDSLWEEYKGATHICYAYVINNDIRFNDDGEPGGTAGKPILNVLINNDLNFILCCVVRYFGGIKLGAGGLVRAYSRCTSEALRCAHLVNLLPGYLVEIKLTYDTIKLLERLNLEIINKEFNEEIKYTLNIKKSDLDLIKPLGNINIIKETLINEVFKKD